MKSCAAAARATADDVVQAGIGSAIGDVVADRAAEQRRLLQDDADLVAQTLERHVAHVVTVDQHAALGDIVEARQQIDDGRLAAAGRAQQRDGLARLDRERHAAEHRLAALEVAESHVVELDSAAAPGPARLRPVCPGSRSACR